VTSSLPGRLRVRMSRPMRHAHLMERVREHVGAQAGVHMVETNRETGSVLVHYDPGRQSTSDLLALFADVGVIVRETASAIGLDAPTVGRSTTSQSIIEALTDIDRRLSHATGRKVDLKLLFPLVLGGLGVRQAARFGLGLSQVPAYVLLWYAFDLFYKLNREIVALDLAASTAQADESGMVGDV
jgi:hypothetical protein